MTRININTIPHRFGNLRSELIKRERKRVFWDRVQLAVAVCLAVYVGWLMLNLGNMAGVVATWAAGQ